MISWEKPDRVTIKRHGVYLVWNNGYKLIETHGLAVIDLMNSPNEWQHPKWITEVTMPLES